MSQLVEVTLSGQTVDVTIDGGNMSAGASLALEALNTAVSDAQDAEAGAQLAATQAEAARDDVVNGLGAKANRNGDNITSGSDWRTALGLGNAATLDVGTTAGTVAAGDDARLQAVDGKADADGSNIDATAFRTELGLQYPTQEEAETGTSNALTMTPLRAMQAARVLVQWINMAERQFAGGVKANGIDDDGPAVRAAMAYAKTFSGNLYGGGAAQVVAPRGIIKIATPDAVFSDTAIDITGMHNVSINGGGDGVTTFKTTGDFAFMKGRDALTNPLYRFGLRDAAVEGPGRANVNAHGIVLGPNNDCIFSDLRLWAVRTGAAFANSFHTEWRSIKMNGQGALSNYDGFHYLDGDLSVVENAAVITGGHVFGCERFGFRGESVTGSFVRGLEVLGCGSIGVYIGDSPSGKDLKWFSWEGGAIDTCPDLLTVRKGSSAVAEKLHFTGLWMGYASEGAPGAGVGADFDGISDSSLYAANITNTTYAALLNNCTRMSVCIDNMDDYDREAVGATGLLVQNTTKSAFSVGSAKKAAGSPSTQAAIETGTSNYNLYMGVFDGEVTTVGPNSVKSGALVY